MAEQAFAPSVTDRLLALALELEGRADRTVMTTVPPDGRVRPRKGGLPLAVTPECFDVGAAGNDLRRPRRGRRGAA